MSRDTGRRFYPVALEPSVSASLGAASHSGPGDASARSSLPSYVALNFNFKPDSTIDCKRGALFQPGPSRNVNADWQLELESTEMVGESGSSSTTDNISASKKKHAHVFTGPQTLAKAYDLVLVWDETARIYRMDRIASTFSLKYERSKTTLSTNGQDVWKSDAVKPSKRSISGGSDIRPAAEWQEGTGRTASTHNPDSNSHSVEATPTLSNGRKPGELKLRSKASPIVAPVRRSSRFSLAVEMEEFDDHSESPAETSKASANRSKRSHTSQETEVRNKEESKKVKLPASAIKDLGVSDEPAAGLRRSRRRSSQAQGDAQSSPHDHSAAEGLSSTVKTDAAKSADGDDDELALELERELQRELEVEMQDANEAEQQARSSEDSTIKVAKSTSNRSLSPVSRLKRGEMRMKISTPKAHSPELDNTPGYPSSSRSEAFKRSISPSTGRSSPTDAGHASNSASIGLGLHLTGVGITPTASPSLDVDSPVDPSKSPLAFEIAAAPAPASKASSKDDEAEEGEEEDDDDDLQDFAAELDLSLAEVPDASCLVPPTVVEKRRSSRASTAAQSTAGAGTRQVRKAYGLGGPRQEEEELEDSD
ncbi:uncharacterized protein UMAG_12168 [Mycosarcoma maydis]|uniref:Transcription elongation factor Eaf N-terminal domain-containing protein n=1 Tax=Mycosarcoma maydis TaxID=5270 RepID=A0A0D1CWA6_MYCMD|nr:uncharacterized protein UMAG_12168 [Ustilago maydis 521]KIS70668.1 hypothetical protein UMAG_12168 [Ustilago maydis 521]|eukprot:XP_011388130.1 hypothetical protein UMAG_12168 [Ustilago maydis 521]